MELQFEKFTMVSTICHTKHTANELMQNNQFANGKVYWIFTLFKNMEQTIGIQIYHAALHHCTFFYAALCKVNVLCQHRERVIAKI